MSTECQTKVTGMGIRLLTRGRQVSRQIRNGLSAQLTCACARGQSNERPRTQLRYRRQMNCVTQHGKMRNWVRWYVRWRFMSIALCGCGHSNMSQWFINLNSAWIFRRIRKVTKIGYQLRRGSVPLSLLLRMRKLGSHWTEFCEILCR
jgi:hypothetical protein